MILSYVMLLPMIMFLYNVTTLYPLNICRYHVDTML